MTILKLRIVLLSVLSFNLAQPVFADGDGLEDQDHSPGTSVHTQRNFTDALAPITVTQRNSWHQAIDDFPAGEFSWRGFMYTAVGVGAF